MSSFPDGSGHDRSVLLDRVTRLVDFLRSMVTSAEQRVLDVEGYPTALWLAQLPPSADLYPEAGPGDVLLSVLPVATELPPEPPPELTDRLDPEQSSDSAGEPPRLMPPLRRLAAPAAPAALLPTAADLPAPTPASFELAELAELESAEFESAEFDLAARTAELELTAETAELVRLDDDAGIEALDGAAGAEPLDGTAELIRLDGAGVLALPAAEPAPGDRTTALLPLDTAELIPVAGSAEPAPLDGTADLDQIDGSADLVLVDGPADLVPAEAPVDDLDLVPADESEAEIQRSYDQWRDRWEAWAEADRGIRAHRRWYDALSRAADRLSQQDDEFELVVGLGLLSWASPAGNRIRRHLVTARVGLAVDPTTGRIDVLLDPVSTPRFEDRDLLEDSPDVGPAFRADRASPVRRRLADEPLAPLSDEYKELFAQWLALALPDCRPYSHALERPTAVTAVPELTFAPALVLRPRTSSDIVGFYDEMLRTLTAPGAIPPLGLAQLVETLDAPERLRWLAARSPAGASSTVDDEPLFPLPTNAEQRRVLERLATDTGVVVQGPPGTGKTHTIANLISALLARGQRVLVTSEKAQALRVLRDEVPPAVQALCVLMTDVRRGGSSQLEQSVAALVDRYSAHDPAAQNALVGSLAAEREAARRRMAEVEEQIRALREGETSGRGEVAPGYRGTLAEIAERVAAGRLGYDWMPAPLPPAGPGIPPLSEAEFAQLRMLLVSATPQRQTRSGQHLPDAGALPSAEAFWELVAAEDAAKQSASEAETPLSAALARLGEPALAELERGTDAAAAALRELGLRPDPASWDAADWRVRAVDDHVARRDRSMWTAVASVAGQAEVARNAVAFIGLHRVELPIDGSSPERAAELRAAARELRGHLAAGGQLRKAFAGPAQRNARLLLEASTVDGQRPTTVERVDLALARLDAEVLAGQLAERWAMVGLHLDPRLPLTARVSTLVDAAQALRLVSRVASARDALDRQLADTGVPAGLNSAYDLIALLRAVSAARSRKLAAAASARIEELTGQLHDLATDVAAAPEVAAAAAAVRSRAPDGYVSALAELAQARVEQQAQLRCDELWHRLHEAHPGLADMLARTADDPVWERRTADLAAAWAWAAASGFLAAQQRPGLEDELARALDEADDRLRALTAELAAERAWQHNLSRMTPEHSQALLAYRGHMQRLGKGTGRYAPRYRRAARDALSEARNAVPAWVMPLRQVLDTIPPVPDSFDVVIVDEASQCGLETLFLLWLAPRVIVVGDDKQCAPSKVVFGELQPIFDRRDAYLPDLPRWSREAFTPANNLYGLLEARFPAVIRLREHFRCMPEIIGWSSRQFYPAEPLVPLRQFGADRLRPLEVRQVPAAWTEGQDQTLRNPVEAEALVDQLVSCLDDPVYADRTFGIVVLQGAGQVALIERLLMDRVRPEVRERRRLRVGMPADFQGDQRDVIFLSMVVAERRRALTDLDTRRRFNVATSRARDQQWLFHSVAADQLAESDLRRSLLRYLHQPPPPYEFVDPGEVDDDRLVSPPFESLFEQRVYRRIRHRGYAVTSQFRVEGRRLDLVVTGAQGRLAVECDGRRWHTDPDQQRADLRRDRELRRVGWEIWRVRESAFALDPDAALAPLWDRLHRRGIRPQQPATMQRA
ncbi:MAG TPA: AAA domain-containing protein [Mycobacteriales bacterium]|nr:AAA domain-containing protein [Mycobacteriales bacterium]